MNFNYTEENYHTWTSYKIYNKEIRTQILDKNPKLPMAKVVTLVGSLWKEFWANNPFKEEIAKAKKAERKIEEKGPGTRMYELYIIHLVMQRSVSVHTW